MKKIRLYLLSIIMQAFLFIVFRTNRWVITGENEFESAIKSTRPIMLCSWHERFLYAVYHFKLKKMKNIWAISSTHQDSQIMAYFLKRSSINLIKGSSTRGWENVIKKMFKTFKKSDAIIAITNDGPKGPPREAKLGSYKIALKSNAHIISIACTSTSYWQAKSWDRLRIPKPFGTIYINFSKPMNVNNKDIGNINSANELTSFLNTHLNELDEKIK